MNPATLRLEQVGGPSLVVSENAAQDLTLTGKYLLGRGTDCQLVLPDAQVSRRHALIEQRGEHYWLTDLDSRAGTFINDLRLDARLAAPLREHDRIRIGAWRFRVRALQDQRSQTGSGYRSNTQATGLTQIGTPMLAAQARLELLVEFVADCANKKDLAGLAEILCDYLLRASSPQRLSIWAEGSSQAMLTHPQNFRPQALEEAFAASCQGGVVMAEAAPSLPAGDCAAVVAIRIDGEAIGFVQVEFAGGKVSDAALESIHALVRLAGFSAGNIERRSAERRVEQLSNDLQQAHEVQRAFLPPASGQINGVEYALHAHPGRVVAGDMVDIFAIDARRCGIILGDVSGAGFGAAVQMASAQAYLHAELLETGDPAVAAQRCNTFLVRFGGGRFVTAWIAVLDCPSGQMQIVDAGHGHARWVQRGRSQMVKLSGAIPLGIDAQAVYQNEAFVLPSEARLLLYSDGVAEHRSAGGAEFSHQIEPLLAQSNSCNEDLALLLQALESHSGRMPDDDATLLSIARPKNRP